MFTIFLLPIINANSVWSMEANADYWGGIGQTTSGDLGGNAFIGFSSNFPTISNGTNYTSCTFDGSDFTPVGGDLDLDGESEIVTVRGTSLDIYNFNCEFKYTIETGDTIRAMPNIINSNGDAYNEIIVLLNDSLKAYQYNPTITNFNIISSVGIPLITFDDMTCIATLDKCILFKSGNTGTYEVFLDTNTTDPHIAVLDFAHNSLNSRGVSNTRTIGNGDFVIPICSGKDSNDLRCHTLDDSGQEINAFTLVTLASINNIPQSDVFIAKIGNVMRIFQSTTIASLGGSTYGTNFTFASIRRLDGTSLIDISQNSPVGTNWVVADYNKDGQNEACIIWGSGAVKNFTCYNSLNDMIVNKAVNTTLHLAQGFVLVDLDNTASTMAIVTATGVYYENGTTIQPIYLTGITDSIARDGVPITLFSDVAGNVGVAYSDNDITMIIKQPSINILCGDGTCQSLENALTCPVDCGSATGTPSTINTTGDPCITDDNCFSGKCQAGFCVLQLSGGECYADSQCLSGSCINNKCSKASYWSLVDAGKTETMGDDTPTNNFVSLFFMIFVPLSILWIGKNVMAVIMATGVFIVLGFFFAIVGWLSAWIIFGLIIFIFVAFFLFVLIGTSGGGGGGGN